ncbi:MAG TPA: hypothetical protein VIS94_07885 [Desulfomonilia bacterium]
MVLPQPDNYILIKKEIPAMCIDCSKMEQLVAENQINLNVVQQLLRENTIELHAGNCLPEEIEMYLDKGNHYTINTYYQCKVCKKYYYIGFCLYGSPIIKEIDKIEVDQGISRLEWGFVGVHFTNHK